MKPKEILRESFTKAEVPVVERVARLTNCQMTILDKKPCGNIIQIKITSEKPKVDFSGFRKMLVSQIEEARKAGIL